MLLLYSSVAFGQSSSLNLSLPSAPGSYQSDRFKAGDLDCSNAIGSATNLEFGVTGIIGRGYTDPLDGYVDSRVGDVGVFARITITLGQKPKSSPRNFNHFRYRMMILNKLLTWGSKN